jgi:hypothetical protein
VPGADKEPLPAEPTRLAIYFVPTEDPPPRPAVPMSPAPAQLPSPPGQKPADTKPVQEPAGGAGAGIGGKGGLFQLGVGQPEGELPVIAPEKLMELVTSLIEPTSWDRRPDVYINTAPGRLIVRQTEPVHRQIRELLQELGVHRQRTSWALGHMGSGN